MSAVCGGQYRTAPEARPGDCYVANFMQVLQRVATDGVWIDNRIYLPRMDSLTANLTVTSTSFASRCLVAVSNNEGCYQFLTSHSFNCHTLN
jgi:hypothetical protein